MRLYGPVPLSLASPAGMRLSQDLFDYSTLCEMGKRGMRGKIRIKKTMERVVFSAKEAVS